MLAGGGSLLETREARDAAALLHFVADPADDLALAATLRGPMVALSDRDLLTLARQAHASKESWWACLQGDADGYARPVRLLSALLAQRRQTLPSRLLQLADALTGYSAVLANLPGAARRRADWFGMVAFVREVEGEAGDLVSVVRRLKRLEDADAEVPRPTLQDSAAVSLMSVHASKGLEWPVVFVADLDREAPNTTSPVLADRYGGVALQLTDDAGEAREPVLYTVLKHRQRSAERAELVRVLYVALTRARDRIVLSATEASGRAYKALLPGLEAAAVPRHFVPHVPSCDDAAPPLVSVETDDTSLWQARVTSASQPPRHAEVCVPRVPSENTRGEGDPRPEVLSEE